MNTQLHSFQNGNFIIHNVPHLIKGKKPFLSRDMLTTIAHLIDIMEQENVYEVDFKQANQKKEDLFKTYKQLASFELNNYAYYKKESNSERITDEERIRYQNKIHLIDNAFTKLNDVRLQEIIHRKYLKKPANKITDNDIILSLSISRTSYYNLKNEALLKIGIELTKESK